VIVQDAPSALAIGSRELAVAGAALVLAGLALTPIAVVITRRMVPPVQVFFARWRFLHAALVALLLWSASWLAPALVERWAGPNEWPAALSALCASVLALGSCAGLIFWYATRLDPEGIDSLGLRAQGSLRAAGAGLVCYALLLPGLFGLTLLWPWLFQSMGGEFKPQPLAVALADVHGVQLALAAGLAILVQPFLEELIFRGFLQPLLVQNLGDRGGVFLASLMFAVLHGDSAFLPIFGLALLMGSLKPRTQRLSAPWLVHALHNGLAFLFLGSS
jgi:membrane protease YdiL (CAAX protease family)